MDLENSVLDLEKRVKRLELINRRRMIFNIVSVIVAIILIILICYFIYKFYGSWIDDDFLISFWFKNI